MSTQVPELVKWPKRKLDVMRCKEGHFRIKRFLTLSNAPLSRRLHGTPSNTTTLVKLNFTHCCIWFPLCWFHMGQKLSYFEPTVLRIKDVCFGFCSLIACKVLENREYEFSCLHLLSSGVWNSADSQKMNVIGCFFQEALQLGSELSNQSCIK